MEYYEIELKSKDRIIRNELLKCQDDLTLTAKRFMAQLYLMQTATESNNEETNSTVRVIAEDDMKRQIEAILEISEKIDVIRQELREREEEE